jgi:phosphate transport system permease protein
VWGRLTDSQGPKATLNRVLALWAVALVIGSQPQITTHLFEAGDSMAAVIVNQFGEASGIHRAALIGLGVVLFGVTIIVNVSARGIVSQFDRRSQGA